MSLVEVSKDGHITTATLANDRRRNALSGELISELLAAGEAAATDGTRVFIIRAAPGVKTWSAGHDISELPTGEDPLSWTTPLEKLFRGVRISPFPVIAAVEGGVWGGACDLVACADLVVAKASATFAITPAKLGVPYNIAGVSHFINAVPLHVIKEMFFLAEPITAEQAHQHGLVNRLVADDEDLTVAVQAVAEQVAALAPLVIRAVKAELSALTDARPLTPDVFERLTAHRRAAWTSADYREGVAAFREKRRPNFTGK